MSSADAVVVPSIYEGYGLPAIEAMACGVPVVASNTTALPEITGSHAILVEPSADGIAHGLTRVLGGIDEGHLERAKAFALARTWGSSAAAHIRLYTRLGALR
jgi:glycosyltransferase involved in cell wall biosynthesis